MKQHELPPGWALAALPDLMSTHGLLTDGDWVESKDQDPEGSVRLTQLADVGDGVWKDRSRRFMTPEKARYLRCTFLKKGDVLIARMPDPLGRACIFPGDGHPCVTVVDVCILRPGNDTVSTQWLAHFVNAPSFRERIYALQRGSTRRRISRKNLCTLLIPVPPADEQHEIVAAIDSYFTRLDNAATTLERAQRNLKRYRASVLQAAVEGRLVPTEAELASAEGRDYEHASGLLERILAERRRRWEVAELAKMQAKGKVPKDDKWKAKYKEPDAPDMSDLHQLPDGWCWASADQLTLLITKGSSPRWQGFQYVEAGVAFVRSQNVGWGSLNLSKLAHVSSAFNAQERKSILRAGDVLLNIVGASIGRAALAGQELAGGNTNQAVAILRCVENGIIPELLVSFLISTSAQRIIHGRKVDVARANLSLADIAAMPVPLPPLEEQRRVLEGISQHLSITAAEAAAVAAAERRCSRLRQAILRWAFEGKLVDQDPTDEPASELLERIRAQRAAAGNGTRTNGRRPQPGMRRAPPKRTPT